MLCVFVYRDKNSVYSKNVLIKTKSSTFFSAYVRSHFDHFPPKLFPKQKRNLTCDWPKIDTKQNSNSNIEIKLDQIES